VLKPQRFRVRLQDAGGGGAAFGLPARAAAALGERKRPPVTVTIRDHTFRTTVAVYGGQPMIGVNKQHRAAARVAVGDSFDVVVALDEEPRVIEVPADLADALADDAAARAAFDRLSYTQPPRVRGVDRRGQATSDPRPASRRDRRTGADGGSGTMSERPAGRESEPGPSGRGSGRQRVDSSSVPLRSKSGNR
jgi:Domain of unknown function (DUF1905)/Bacteriocin-protection, YdeI or OmpD-Associated